MLQALLNHRIQRTIVYETQSNQASEKLITENTISHKKIFGNYFLLMNMLDMCCESQFVIQFCEYSIDYISHETENIV